MGQQDGSVGHRGGLLEREEKLFVPTFIEAQLVSNKARTEEYKGTLCVTDTL